MKFSLLIAAAALFLLAGCSSEGFFSEPAPNALNGLTDLNKAPEFSFDWINKNQINPSENQIQGNDIEIVGWAIDPDSKQLASEVYIMVNDEVFTAEYGIARDDVADYFKNPALQKCGFRAKFSRSTFIPGVYSIGVKVISADKSSYYSSPPERTVVIKL